MDLIEKLKNESVIQNNEDLENIIKFLEKEELFDKKINRSNKKVQYSEEEIMIKIKEIFEFIHENKFEEASFILKDNSISEKIISIKKKKEVLNLLKDKMSQIKNEEEKMYLLKCFSTLSTFKQLYKAYNENRKIEIEKEIYNENFFEDYLKKRKLFIISDYKIFCLGLKIDKKIFFRKILTKLYFTNLYFIKSKRFFRYKKIEDKLEGEEKDRYDNDKLYFLLKRLKSFYDFFEFIKKIFLQEKNFFYEDKNQNPFSPTSNTPNTPVIDSPKKVKSLSLKERGIDINQYFRNIFRFIVEDKLIKFSFENYVKSSFILFMNFEKEGFSLKYKKRKTLYFTMIEQFENVFQILKLLDMSNYFDDFISTFYTCIQELFSLYNTLCKSLSNNNLEGLEIENLFEVLNVMSYKPIIFIKYDECQLFLKKNLNSIISLCIDYYLNIFQSFIFIDLKTQNWMSSRNITNPILKPSYGLRFYFYFLKVLFFDLGKIDNVSIQMQIFNLFFEKTLTIFVDFFISIYPSRTRNKQLKYDVIYLVYIVRSLRKYILEDKKKHFKQLLLNLLVFSAIQFSPLNFLVEYLKKDNKEKVFLNKNFFDNFYNSKDNTDVELFVPKCIWNPPQLYISQNNFDVKKEYTDINPLLAHNFFEKEIEDIKYYILFNGLFSCGITEHELFKRIKERHEFLKNQYPPLSVVEEDNFKEMKELLVEKGFEKRKDGNVSKDVTFEKIEKIEGDVVEKEEEEEEEEEEKKDEQEEQIEIQEKKK